MIGSNGSANEHVYPNIVEGTVEAKNDRGIRINGDWFNVSNFKPVTLPDVGQLVRLKVQPKGFINSLEIIQPTSAPTAPSERDTRISRLAVLKAAAAFAATRQDIRSSDVLKIADAWLAWVER
jgi:hypothetical protein